jgi:hypothetical protein
MQLYFNTNPIHDMLIAEPSALNHILGCCESQHDQTNLGNFRHQFICAACT